MIAQLCLVLAAFTCSEAISGVPANVIERSWKIHRGVEQAPGTELSHSTVKSWHIEGTARLREDSDGGDPDDVSCSIDLDLGTIESNWTYRLRNGTVSTGYIAHRHELEDVFDLLNTEGINSVAITSYAPKYKAAGISMPSKGSLAICLSETLPQDASVLLHEIGHLAGESHKVIIQDNIMTAYDSDVHPRGVKGRNRLNCSQCSSYVRLARGQANVSTSGAPSVQVTDEAEKDSSSLENFVKKEWPEGIDYELAQEFRNEAAIEVLLSNLEDETFSSYSGNIAQLLAYVAPPNEDRVADALFAHLESDVGFESDAELSTPKLFGMISEKTRVISWIGLINGQRSTERLLEILQAGSLEDIEFEWSKQIPENFPGGEQAVFEMLIGAAATALVFAQSDIGIQQIEQMYQQELVELESSADRGLGLFYALSSALAMKDLIAETSLLQVKTLLADEARLLDALSTHLDQYPVPD